MNPASQFYDMRKQVRNYSGRRSVQPLSRAISVARFVSHNYLLCERPAGENLRATLIPW